MRINNNYCESQSSLFSVALLKKHMVSKLACKATEGKYSFACNYRREHTVTNDVSVVTICQHNCDKDFHISNIACSKASVSDTNRHRKHHTKIQHYP